LKQKKSHKLSAQKLADLILLTAAILFLISYPYHKSFWGGLIFSFASAALVGGIADWFAIKSFFTKPLGISWPEALFKTEMIPKNREEVITVIVDIVQDKVITKDALAQKIKEVGVSSLLIDYVADNKILNSTAEEIMGKMNFSSIKENQEYFKSLARKFVGQNKDEIYKAIHHVFNWAINKGYIHNILSSLAKELQKLLKLPGVYDKFSVLFKGAMHRCQRNIILKGFLKSISIFKDIPKSLLQQADKGIEFVKDPSFIENQNFINFIQQNKRAVQYSVIITLRNMIRTVDFIALYNEFAPKSLEDGTAKEGIYRIADGGIDALNIKLKEDIELREKIIVKLDLILSNFLYEKIEFIIKNKLKEYSNEMLTEEIYNSVGEDLNMVRFTGSFIGGAVGIITFIIMYVAG
jgi:uncharacterized membrane-anchored protein YjiN (DUF445 family)